MSWISKLRYRSSRQNCPCQCIMHLPWICVGSPTHPPLSVTRTKRTLHTAAARQCPLTRLALEELCYILVKQSSKRLRSLLLDFFHSLNLDGCISYRRCIWTYVFISATRLILLLFFWEETSIHPRYKYMISGETFDSQNHNASSTVRRRIKESYDLIQRKNLL